MKIGLGTVFNWERRYCEYRKSGKSIYFTDETWVNAGHTRNKVWHDLSVLSKRDAFVRGLSTGLKNKTQEGFLKGGLLSFESKSSRDYHEEINATVSERLFKKIFTVIKTKFSSWVAE